MIKESCLCQPTTFASPPPKDPPPPPLPAPGGTGGTPGTVTASVNVPVAPKFGGIVGGYAVWIGGPPLADFSGTSLACMAAFEALILDLRSRATKPV